MRRRDAAEPIITLNDFLRLPIRTRRFGHAPSTNSRVCAKGPTLASHRSLKLLIGTASLLRMNQKMNQNAIRGQA
jgi:hypothetical protein